MANSMCIGNNYVHASLHAPFDGKPRQHPSITPHLPRFEHQQLRVPPNACRWQRGGHPAAGGGHDPTAAQVGARGGQPDAGPLQHTRALVDAAGVALVEVGPQQGAAGGAAQQSAILIPVTYTTSGRPALRFGRDP